MDPNISQQQIQPEIPPPTSNSTFTVRRLLIYLLAIVILVPTAFGIYILAKGSAPKQVACTMETKICPDGSSVGRTGPKCEFAPCPTSTSDPTANWKTYSGSGYTIKHPNFLKVSRSTHEGFGGTITVDNFDPGIYIYSYAEGVNPSLEFNAKTESDTNITIANQVARKLTGEEIISNKGTLIHVGPIKNNGENYMFIYTSGGKEATSEDLNTFDQMLSTFKFTN